MKLFLPLLLLLFTLAAHAEPELQSSEDCIPYKMKFIQLKEEIAAPRSVVFQFYQDVYPADIIGKNAQAKSKDPWEGLSEELLYENNLKYFFLTLPLNIRFTKINKDDYWIRFEYVRAPSEGFQEIQFFEYGDSTIIVHNACYRGINKFVNIFYPDVHRKVLRPLHSNSKFVLEFKSQFEKYCPDSKEICELLGKSPIELSRLLKSTKYKKLLKKLKRDRFPAALNESELDDFNHLSEGSDIFPYEWWIRLKSSRDRDLTDVWGINLTDDLDRRSGALYQKTPTKYVSNVVGLSVTWSNHPAQKSDALKSDPEATQKGFPVRILNNEPSIRMIGPNCAACHTGSLKTENGIYPIAGGQANISLDRFFRDMVISTLALTINFEDQLTHFLQTFEYSPKEAKRLAENFKKTTLKQGRVGTKIRLLLKQLNIVAQLPPHFLAAEEKNLALQFKRLLRLTMHLPEDAPLGNELERRMDFLAKFATGTPKKTFQDGKWTTFHETLAGYGRIDAFVNAFNITLRKKRERADASAPLGYPAIWGIQDKKYIHYTANTNSVLLRNVGQAMGGGAILLDDKWNSTVNIPNLHRLENLMYKLEAPKWEDVFKNEGAGFKISETKAQRGRVVFKNNCASCHQPQNIEHSYDIPLMDYGVHKQKDIGTDPELAKQIVKPIQPLSDPESYPKKYYELETRGIVESYFKRNNVDRATQEMYSFRSYRGDEWYRDTKIDLPESSYTTRDLSGIWATAPFLHNNSVPTLWDLLQKKSKRPVVFRQGLQFFDPHKVGSKNSEMGLNDCVRPHRKDYKWDEYQCLDTRLRGNSNAGHEFGTDLSDEEKWDLIEYLKVMAPFEAGRNPASEKHGKKTPFMKEFDRIELRNLPLAGRALKEKDLLRHRLRTLSAWLIKDPVQMFTELREQRPIAFMSSMPIKKFKAPNTGVVVVTKYDDVIDVMGRPAEFSVRHFSFKLNALGGHMLSTDETRFNLVEKPWMRGLMPSKDSDRLQLIIEKLVDESFALASKSGTGADGKIRMNLVRDLARRVPILLSKEYFGYPGPDMETMYRWSYAMQNDAFHNPTNKTKIRKTALKVAGEMKEYSIKLIETTRTELAKNSNQVIKDTILERLILSPEVTTQEITDDRVGINILSTLVAGVETVQAAVVNSLEYFLKNPHHMELARTAAKANDLKLLHKYILEALRFNPINPMLLRYTEKDSFIAKGTPRERLIPMGTTVFVGTQSAMLDPLKVSDPHEFKIDRTGFEYLHFGYGHHKCLGERVAMIELPVIIKSLLLKKNLKLSANLDKPGMPFPERRMIEFDKE